ncbi:hypothetical protein [Streptomyces regalis]|uniref:Uncharacterized protein n=1 Tax=Streptomyces regalis TaxID=68262 RepID=A0A0X3UQD0_9ACTN|nr:hypothetical protein [Streptomyces regalis]KUL34778.1 hypothetical protein ADL12_20650 [Streptomyces regalis]
MKWGKPKKSLEDLLKAERERAVGHEERERVRKAWDDAAREVARMIRQTPIGSYARLHWDGSTPPDVPEEKGYIGWDLSLRLPFTPDAAGRKGVKRILHDLEDLHERLGGKVSVEETSSIRNYDYPDEVQFTLVTVTITCTVQDRPVRVTARYSR